MPGAHENPLDQSVRLPLAYSLPLWHRKGKMLHSPTGVNRPPHLIDASWLELLKVIVQDMLSLSIRYVDWGNK